MISPMDLQQRTVVVTGASSGIGRATSVLLSQLGARVLLIGRNEKRLAETASQLSGEGHRVEPFDLNEVDSIAQWLKGLSSETGVLHGLVHCAGVHITRPLRFLSNDDVDGVMRINLNAAIGLAKGFRQKGVCQSGGSIVLLSSVMALVGQPGVAAYAASKGAIAALTKSLSLELARDGVRINCIAAAQVETEMTEAMHQSLSPEQVAEIHAMHPLGIGTPLDVAHAVAFLLADTARWITGTTLVVDGGYTAH
jgi:NAD(P)-dependent dehydrogenase (short-subunit alcohol dehydrogenase family)